MTEPRIYYADDRVTLIHGRWQDALAAGMVPRVAAVISDPPYSARTHGKQRHGRRDEVCNSRYVSARGIDYSALTEEAAVEFVRGMAAACDGWICILTDSELANPIKAELRACARTDFAPLPVVMRGMNVRLAGDGPSSWAVWLVVARPKSLRAWGTLPGAYVGLPWDGGENSATAGRRSSVVGGKPVWLMRAIVGDYTRPGDLVLDPCAGGGTTGVACKLDGRRCILIEQDEATCEIAARRVSDTVREHARQTVLGL